MEIETELRNSRCRPVVNAGRVVAMVVHMSWVVRDKIDRELAVRHAIETAAAGRTVLVQAAAVVWLRWALHHGASTEYPS